MLRIISFICESCRNTGTATILHRYYTNTASILHQYFGFCSDMCLLNPDIVLQTHISSFGPFI